MACQLLTLACVLGFPLSWHKVDLGDPAKLDRLGFAFSGLPQRILASVKA